MIKGQLQSVQINDYGYSRIKVSGTYYGADKKGALNVAEGDMVEFDAYEKTGSNGKQYPTFKYTSIKKLAEAAPAPVASVAPAGKSGGAPSSYQTEAAARAAYWADKEARDIAKDPQIAYQGSYDRALTFASLALANGAFDALAKAKPTAKLAILEAFVAEQADKIMALVYAAKVPAKTAAKTVEASEEAKEETAADESWS